MTERARDGKSNANPIAPARVESCEHKQQRSKFDYRIESSMTRYRQTEVRSSGSSEEA